MTRFLKLGLAVIGVESVGILSSFFTISSIPTWYQALNKPFFNPPNWIFGPVWTILYILIGVSIFLVLEKASKNKRTFLSSLFLVQLVLNFFWTFIFFGLHNPLLAFIEIIFLWISILVLILKFRKYSKTASIILIPYLLWVSFAALLNLSIFLLNK